MASYIVINMNMKDTMIHISIYHRDDNDDNDDGDDDDDDDYNDDD